MKRPIATLAAIAATPMYPLVLSPTPKISKFTVITDAQACCTPVENEKPIKQKLIFLSLINVITLSTNPLFGISPHGDEAVGGDSGFEGK